MRSKDETMDAESNVDSTEGTMVNSEALGIGQNELATLKDVARLGSFDSSIETTAGELADVFGTSNQTVLRRLQALDEGGLLHRHPNTDGHTIALTDAGRKLLAREFVQYRELFDSIGSVTLSGAVTDGAGEGGHFVSLEGYKEQFVDLLDYEPYAGTFNIELDEVNVAKRTELDHIDAIEIDGWEEDGRSFGPVACYPATIETVDGRTFDPVHILDPERTHHGPEQLELIADVRLRDELDIETGEVIAAHVL